MISKFKGYAVCAAAAATLVLGGCASTGATKTISTLAGSSAGAVVGKAVSVSGPWGYVVSIASSAVGGFAGDRASRLFGGKTDKLETDALAKVLASSQPAALEPWGAQDGKKAGGYAAATSPLFLSNAGANCRSFMLVTYKKKGFSLDPASIQQGVGAVSDAKASADKLGNINTVGDAASAAKDAASAAGSVKDTVSSIGGSKDAAPAAKAATPAHPAGKERFGTACLNAKEQWQVVKAG